MEISEANIRKMKPVELEFTSKRDGFQRFHTPTVRRLIEQLEDAEDRKEQAITPFICGIFIKFHGLHLVWSQLIRCLSELDCLASLAVVSGGVNIAVVIFVRRICASQSLLGSKIMVVSRILS